MKVIVTRPLAAGRKLADSIEQAGGEVFVVPTISIAAVTPSSDLLRRVQRSACADWAVFVSANAARHALDLAGQSGVDLTSVKLATMGPATSQVLEHAGQKVSLECPAPLSSESLLACPEMMSVRNATIFIFRGRGGRETLAQTLRERGAHVEYVECYERKTPPIAIEKLPGSGAGRVVVSTTTHGLTNLIAAVKQQKAFHVIEFALLVAGERQRRDACAAGWKGPVYAAHDASNSAILRKLTEISN